MLENFNCGLLLRSESRDEADELDSDDDDDDDAELLSLSDEVDDDDESPLVDEELALLFDDSDSDPDEPEESELVSESELLVDDGVGGRRLRRLWLDLPLFSSSLLFGPAFFDERRCLSSSSSSSFCFATERDPDRCL